MNLMAIVLSPTELQDKKINDKIVKLRELIIDEKIRISDQRIDVGEGKYYFNCLPNIPENRDVLKKAYDICPIRINWKHKPFDGLTTTEIYNQLKQQYGFCVTTVDKEHTRNNFRNKESFWVVFDSLKVAEKYLKVFNMLFRTAIEQDAIDEYKRFKQNPEKRPLTYDKLVASAYELYAEIDKEDN